MKEFDELEKKLNKISEKFDLSMNNLSKDIDKMYKKIELSFDIEEISMNTANIDYSVVKEIANFKDDIIAIKEVKRFQEEKYREVKLKMEIFDITNFTFEYLSRTLKISKKIEVNEYLKEIIFLEDEVIFKNRTEINFLKFQDFRKISIKYSFINSKNFDKRTGESESDMILLDIIIGNEKNELISYAIGLAKYFKYKGKIYELKYDLDKIEKNVANLFLYNYSVYKEKSELLNKL